MMWKISYWECIIGVFAFCNVSFDLLVSIM